MGILFKVINSTFFNINDRTGMWREPYSRYLSAEPLFPSRKHFIPVIV